MAQHQEQIIAVKDRIKPGIMAKLFTPFNKDMLKQYLRELKSRYIGKKEAIIEEDENCDDDELNRDIEAQGQNEMLS